MVVKSDWRVFVFVKFCAKIYHVVFVALTEGTGGATSAAVVQKDNNICQHQLVVGPELKRLEAKKKHCFFFLQILFTIFTLKQSNFFNINFNLNVLYRQFVKLTSTLCNRTVLLFKGFGVCFFLVCVKF